jgi:predicted N-acetyltransferase YhbS
MQFDPESIQIRLATQEDDIGQLTQMLHRAYAELGRLGWRFKAVDQSEDVTRQRMARGECYLAVTNGTIVGTVLFQPPDKASGSPWLDRPDVAALHQLAVEPALQRSGLGGRLVDWAEARALAFGAREIALDTAEPAQHLRAWYASRGYRQIEYAQWSHTNYRSVVMSKTL